MASQIWMMRIYDLTNILLFHHCWGGKVRVEKRKNVLVWKEVGADSYSFCCRNSHGLLVFLSQPVFRKIDDNGIFRVLWELFRMPFVELSSYVLSFVFNYYGPMFQVSDKEKVFLFWRCFNSQMVFHHLHYSLFPPTPTILKALAYVFSRHFSRRH